MRVPEAVGKLRAELPGQVVMPTDQEYEQARLVVNGAVDKRPAAIVRPDTAEQVARVVTLARETGAELAVRSGGHSGAGHGASEGGIVLDVKRLRDLSIDTAGRTAWAGAGLTTGEYTTAAAGHGLATGFGDTGSVGLSGLTLGGGMGYLSRRHGLTVDNLLAAELVTADGRIRHVDVDSEPDLFWAIRGGGGNFGVATKFQYRLHEVRSVVGGVLVLPATPEVITGFVAHAARAPDELSTIANVMTAPPMPFLPPELHGSLVLLGLMCYSGPPERAEAVLAPFRAMAEPLADLVRPIPYPEMFFPEAPDYRPVAAARTLFADSVTPAAAAETLRRLAASDAPMRAAQFRVLGGAISRVPADATAYGHRDRQIMINVAAFYQSPQERAVREEWVDGLAGVLRQGEPAGYVNFVPDDLPGRVAEAYPEPTLTRLREVKARFDPENLFRRNVNIPPA